MNKYIHKLTENYFYNYTHCALLYPKTTPVQRLEDSLREMFRYRDSLFEEYHVVDMFECVSDTIVLLFNNNPKLGKQIYTGWIFNIDTSVCSRKTINNISDNEIPIYVVIAETDEKVYATVLDREDSGDKIVIEINKTYISDEFLKGICSHEFFHAREMFARKDKNILNSFKNRILSNDEDNLFLWDKDRHNYIFNDATRFVNCLKQSEQRARLNAVGNFIKRLSKYKFNEICKNILNKHDIVSTIFDYVDKLSMFQYLLHTIDKLGLFISTNGPSLEVYMYYANKIGLVKTKLNKYSFDTKRSPYTYTKDEKDRFEAFIFELKTELNAFKMKCQKIIYNELYKKGFI